MLDPRVARTMRLPDSPLNPPGICGARFLRQQKAGVTFFGRTVTRSRSERQNAETGVMGAAAEAQPISPELVLVSPELREHALELLPALDPDALFAVAPSPRPAPPPEPRREPDPEPRPEHDRDRERPQLVLVEPEPPTPRLPVAVAVYATEALLLGAVRAAGLTAAITILAFLLAR
jgi:hypothetical protein